MRRRPARVLLGLVAGWSVVILADLLGLDVWLLPLILLGTASLLRSGRTLLDRLLVALMLLAGATIAAGIAFSRWPWHLEPVPIGLLAVTVLAGAALVTGREPRLPWPSWWDALPLGAGLSVTALLSVPYFRLSGSLGTLAAVMVGEDPSRHMSTLDGIRRAGGYAWLNWAQTAPVAPGNMHYYPQGWHLLAAVVDNFVRSSSTDLGSPLSLPDHFAVYSLAGIGLLTTAIVWAALRVAAPVLNLFRGTVLAVLLASQVVGTEMVRLLALGYPAETLALTAVAVLVGVLARPLQRPREQLLLVAGLVITVGFAYYLFLPPVLVMVLWWVWVRRRALRRVPVTTVVCALTTALVAPIPAVIGYVKADQTTALTYGAIWQNPPYLTLAVMGLAIVVAIAAFGRRSRALRRYLAVLLIAVAYAVALAINSLVQGISPGYYFGKAIHLAFVVGIAGLGTVALFAGLPRQVGRRSAPMARRLVPAALALALIVTIVGVPPGRISQHLGWTPQDDRSWPSMFVSGDWNKPREARLVAAADAQYPPIAGATTLILDFDDPHVYFDSLYLSALQHTSGATGPYIYGHSGPTLSERILKTLKSTKGPIRFIVVDARAYDALDQVLTAHPNFAARVSVRALAGIQPPDGTH